MLLVLEQLYTEGIAQLSYVVGDNADTMVVDVHQLNNSLPVLE